MNISVTLQHGPLNIEIEADGEEDYKKEIEDILKIVDEYSRIPESRGEESAVAEAAEQTESDQSDINLGDGPLAPLAGELGVSSSDLERIIHLSEDSSEATYLLVDDVGLLGDKLPERQRTVALVTMYAEYVCNGKEEFTGPELKETVDASDLSTNNMYKMREDAGKSYFNHNGGKGNASRIKLRGPGRRAAKDEILRILEESES